MCAIALAEDLNSPQGSDITAELIPEQTQANATLITREDAVICGVNWVEKIYQLLGNDVQVKWKVADGSIVEAGDTICEISGNARQLLTGERAAMNFLQSLSATATLTNQYVELIKKTQCKLLDTRKTVPGMRYGQKYAVKCGGGVNHRIGLSDAYLIKENHIMACGGILAALSQAKTQHPNTMVEIEVESLQELKLAIEGKADVIMLDNFDIEQLKRARSLVDSTAPTIKLEASGNVNKQTIADIAATGVDFISVGALTKDIKAVDLSLRINLTTK
ncbi:MAG: carboxylating nicotinate-nucleotide diphosphorylase [Kangiellaceae bacterium]